MVAVVGTAGAVGAGAVAARASPVASGKASSSATAWRAASAAIRLRPLARSSVRSASWRAVSEWLGSICRMSRHTAIAWTTNPLSA